MEATKRRSDGATKGRAFIVLVLAASLGLLGLVGCDKPATPPSGEASKFRVALILPGSETDQGWNQMAKQGLDRIQKELGAEVRLVSHVKTSDFASQISYFADEGFNVVICHGGEFEREVAKAAKKYPKVSFVVGGCPNDIPDAAAIEFLAGDASTLVGVVAGQVSRTKKAAFIGAMPVPTLEACYTGMKRGIDKAGTGVELLAPQWTNSWDDPTVAKRKTEAAIKAGGCDVIYQNVDAAARGVFEAVREQSTSQKPLYAFGCNSNQNAIAPDVILGSVVIDVPRAYFELAKEAKEGKKHVGAVKLGIKGGYVDLVLNDAHPALTPVIKASVEQARGELVK